MNTMNTMTTISNMKKRETTHKKKPVSECARLGYTLPPEVEALIKEYSQPMYRLPLHFKAINTLFVFQKRGLMRFALEWTCPECTNILLQTRLNVRYREAQMRYRRLAIGEIYEELSRAIFASEIHAQGLFRRDILKTSRNLIFVQDNSGKPISYNSAPMNCANVYVEILAGTCTTIFIISPYVLSMHKVFYFPVAVMLAALLLQHIRINMKYL